MSPLQTWAMVDLNLPDFIEGSQVKKPILSEEMLSNELMSLRDATPRVVRLSRSDGLRVSIGVGGLFGFVQVYKKQDAQWIVHMYKPDVQIASSAVNFSHHGIAHIVETEFLAPVSVCVQLVLGIYRGDSLSPSFVKIE